MKLCCLADDKLNAKPERRDTVITELTEATHKPLCKVNVSLHHCCIRKLS